VIFLDEQSESQRLRTLATLQEFKGNALFGSQTSLLITILIEQELLSMDIARSLMRDYHKRHPYLAVFSITNNRDFNEFAMRHSAKHSPEIRVASKLLDYDYYGGIQLYS
jgi:hypothetical protein